MYDKKHNILIITLGTRKQMGSSRLRVYDFLSYIKQHDLCRDFKIKIITKPILLRINFFTTFKHGIALTLFYIKLIWSLRKKWYVIECLQCFFPSWLAGYISRKNCLILDFTDLGGFDIEFVKKNCNIRGILGWLYLKKRTAERKNMLATCNYASLILSNTGNTLPPFLLPYKNKFRTLTDPVDVDTFIPGIDKKPLVIGWTGSQGTAYLVNSIKNVLLDIKNKYSDKIEIRLFGSNDETPFDPEIRGIATIVKWSLENSIDETRKIRIGLAPAFDDVLARYKQPLKILQYMSVGAPVIAAPIGMVPYLISESETGFFAETNKEWMEYICSLIENTSLRERMSNAARKCAVEKFSYEAYTENWYSFLQEAGNLSSSKS